MAFITIAGQNQIAKKQGENTTLNITKFVLANVPNLGSEPATRIENIPNSSVVDQLSVTKSGYVNTNQVVYSLVMGSNIGNYSFNWVGLVDDEGVLIAVTYIPLTQKTKNDGGVPGNTFTRNFLLAYTGIQQTTAINVPAETWQIDFSARLSGIDERERLSNLDIYGHEGFLGDGWKVTGSAGTYSVGAGIGYVGGVRAKNTAPQEITTATFPNEIWLNVSLQGDISDMTAVAEFVIDTGPFADYVDGNGIEHYLTKIATIASNGAVTDSRVIYDPRDASQLDKGTVPADRLSGSYNITASNATSAANAEAAAKSLELASNVGLLHTDINSLYLSNNVKNDRTRRIGDGYASRIWLDRATGLIRVQVGASGLAESAINWIDALTINANGSVNQIPLKASAAQVAGGTNDKSFITPFELKNAGITDLPQKTIGIGQSQYNVTEFRFANTEYTNIEDAPIVVSIYCTGDFNQRLLVDGETFDFSPSVPGVDIGMQAIVLPGSKYELIGTVREITSWLEVKKAV